MSNEKIPNGEIAQRLNNSVLSVISAEKLMGFEKAYLIASAAGELKRLLTTEYMRPIMDLQGNRLGFKTDKDLNKDGSKGSGYPEEVVKNCLIEAVLMGVQPFGNQFNIIAGNSYVTKEGFGFLLLNHKGLYYEITPELPRINADKSSAAIAMNIEWSIDGGTTKTKKIDLPIKMNAYMGPDAVIGKATRKARAWLYNTITGSEIPEGDTYDAEVTVVSSKTNGEAPCTLEDIETLFSLKKEVLTEDEIKNANRIIQNREEKSYSKLSKLLQVK